MRFTHVVNKADCDVNLRCFQRDPNEPVPGCEGGLEDDSRTDFCVAIVLPEIEETNNFPLGLCEGDCDTGKKATFDVFSEFMTFGYASHCSLPFCCS